jgi:hypothetical protein
VDITAIREGIAANLTAKFGPDSDLAGLGITVSARISSPPDAPALQVLKGPTNYDEAMGAGTLSKLDFLVAAYLSLPADDEAQDVLDALLSYPGDRSVKQAIEIVDGPTGSKVTLDGACGDLRVTDDSGHKILTVAGMEFLAAFWTLEVWA